MTQAKTIEERAEEWAAEAFARIRPEDYSEFNLSRAFIAGAQSQRQRIEELEGALKEASDCIKSEIKGGYFQIGKEYLAEDAIKTHRLLNEIEAVLGGNRG